MRTTAERVIISGVMLILVVASIIGNVAVIVKLITLGKDFRRNHLIFIFNYAIIEFLLASFVMGVNAAYVISNQWILGNFICSLSCSVNYFCIISSTVTFSLLIIDRYMAICHSLRYNTFVTKSKIQLQILFIWIIGILFSTVPVHQKAIITSYYELGCAVDWLAASSFIIVFVTFTFVLFFAIPLFVIMYCYYRIISKIKEISQTFQSPNVIPSNTISERISSDQKVIRSHEILLFAIVMSIGPYWISKILKMSQDQEFGPNYLTTAGSLVPLIGSLITPLIYVNMQTEICVVTEVEDGINV
uniref:GCR129 n=1 Tax=Schmidtea mediterranea TaxID=79327 RepID=A0A193KUE2_SCHMD|nr:GCR129 [Schmidtea mediterranea]